MSSMKSVLALLLIISVLNVADVWTTSQVLQKGGIELNPFFKEVTVETIIIIKMGVLFMLSTVTISGYQQAVKENSKDGKRIIWALIGATIFYSYVVIHNSLNLIEV